MNPAPPFHFASLQAAERALEAELPRLLSIIPLTHQFVTVTAVFLCVLAPGLLAGLLAVFAAEGASKRRGAGAVFIITAVVLLQFPAFHPVSGICGLVICFGIFIVLVPEFIASVAGYALAGLIAVAYIPLALAPGGFVLGYCLSRLDSVAAQYGALWHPALVIAVFTPFVAAAARLLGLKNSN